MSTSVPQPMLTQTRKRWITSVASYPVVAAPPNLRAIIVGRTWAGHIKNLDNTTTPPTAPPTVTTQWWRCSTSHLRCSAERGKA